MRYDAAMPAPAYQTRRAGGTWRVRRVQPSKFDDGLAAKPRQSGVIFHLPGLLR